MKVGLTVIMIFMVQVVTTAILFHYESLQVKILFSILLEFWCKLWYSENWYFLFGSCDL